MNVILPFFAMILYIAIILIAWGIAIVSGALTITTYVVEAYSLFAIASRRKINLPWLAFFPVANMWIMGCVSDHYQQVVKGKEKNMRKILPFAPIAVTVSGVLYISMIFAMYFALAIVAGIAGATGGEDFLIGMIIILAVALYAVLIGGGLLYNAIYAAATVLKNLGYYDLLMSANPDKAGFNLLMSLFVPYAAAVIMFLERNNDLGFSGEAVAVEGTQYLPEL